MSHSASGAAGSELDSRKQPKKAAIAAWIGSVLEYYDFFIYGTASSLIFNKLFFDTKTNPAVATILSFATFGVAYVARPVGAVVLGHWGDRYGRKPVLMFTIILMGVATFLIGCLPTYPQVGALAPVLLVILRLLQGFSAGGEQSGANSMSLEHAPDDRRGYFTSWTLSGTQAGQILAAGIFIPMGMFGDEFFLSWGWRVPFWLSAAVVFIGLYIRRTLEETPVFEDEAVEGEVVKSPVAATFAHHWQAVLRVTICACVNVVPTTFGLWALNYAVDHRGINRNTMLLVTAAVNAVALLFIPMWANLADRIGRKPVFIASTLGCGVLMYFYLTVINAGNIPMIFLVAILMQGVVYSGLNGIWPSFYAEMFPTKVRVTGMAIGTQIGFALGGFAPTIAGALAPEAWVTGWLPVYLFVAAVCVAVALVAATARETAHETLADIDAREAARIGA